MQQKIENAELQARKARERASQSTDEPAREQWSTVARMWDELAREYTALQKLKLTSTIGPAADSPSNQ